MAYRRVVCFLCGEPGHIQRYCPRIWCRICKTYGHIQTDCPERKCYICNQYGHIQYNCPASRQTSGTQAPGPSSGRDRCESGPPARNQPCGQAGVPASPLGGNTTTTRPVSSSITASKVHSFFLQHPTVGTESWLGYSRQASATCYSPRSRKSFDPPSPSRPLMDKDKQSNIRSVETVKRVAETIYKMLKDDFGPIQILVDKQFSDFQENNNPGLLTIPERESDLKRGDFDIIIIHRGYGYVHLEVKAFGDAQEDLTEEEKVQKLVTVLREKTLGRLHKGRQALTYLQPPGERVNIVNTIAFPNVTRDLLRRALLKNAETRKKLTDCISPSGKHTVEELCLCSDDLPPKDGLVEERDPDIKKAIRTWWSLITTLGLRNPELSSDAYRRILASFFNNEDVKTLPQVVQDIGARFEHVWLDKCQAEVLKSEEQYMYIAGPPGSGKTLLLARKAVLWLREKRTVFVLYSRGNTNQSATEFLCHFMKMVTGSDNDVDLSLLREIKVSDFSRLEDVLTEILRIKENPTLGLAPRSLRQQSQDSALSEELSAPHEELEKVSSPAVQIPQDSALSEELSAPHKELEKVSSPAVQIPQDSALSEELSAPHEELEKVSSPAVQIPQDSALSEELSAPHEELEKVSSPAVQIPQDSALSEELSVPHEELEKVFSPAGQIPQDSALSEELSTPHEELEVSSPASQIPAREITADVTAADKGENICVIIDEINMRVNKEESKELLKAIRKWFPAAKIWCAGQFPSHKPGKFHMEQLVLPYRCTPKTQRLLQALEPFCRNELQQPIFNYVTSSTCVRDDTSPSDYQYRLPDDGLDPVFFSHEGHGLQGIYNCAACAMALTTYLKDTLKIGQKDASGKGLEQSDVLIAVTSTVLYNNMQALVYTPLYRKLTAANFTVNVYQVGDPFELDKAGICLMHTRMVAGMEKKVVVSIPSNQYQAAKLDLARTYAEVVRGSPANSAATTPALTAPSQTRPSPGSNLEPSQGHEEIPSSSQGLAQDHTHHHTRDMENTPHHIREDSELPIRDILQQCQTLTQNQRDKLARLGHLNLHWLWYSISRSLAHNVVFHF